MKQLLKSSSLISKIYNAAPCFVVNGCIVFLLWPLNLVGQTNLVPNPSFESYTSCPNSSGQIDKATPWYSLPSNNIEYYNSCSSLYGVPSRMGGDYQRARTGNAYIGLWTINGIGNNYREYLQCSLSSGLQPNQCYFISFFVNLQNGVSLSTNNIGALLSATSNVSNSTPQVLLYSNPIVYDTLNWINVSGFYTAKGGESYLTIGNFKDDQSTLIRIDPTGNYEGAYYFIDDVSVIEIDNTFKPTWTYRDTTITQGDSVFIGTRTNGLKSIWYQNGTVIGDSVPGLYVRPQVNTSYVVKEIIPCGNTRYDTVFVTVTPDPVAISVSAKKACFGEQNGIATVAVTSGIQPFTYKWSNGTKTAQATGLSAGTYTFTVTDKHTNTATVSIVVLENPKLQATLSITAPTSGNNGATTVNVTGGTKPYTYLWSNGKTTAGITGLKDGHYYITVTDSNNCQLKDTAAVGDVSGTNELIHQFENVSIYPNPVTSACGGGILTIESAEKIEQVEIFNVLGIKIFSLANAKSIGLSGFEKGIYFLKLKIKNTEIVKRIVIQ